jgi:hypothetical protein
MTKTEKLVAALAMIEGFVDVNRPTTLAEAEHLLDIIDVIAASALKDTGQVRLAS